jgi:short-subunit dehydrogenase
MNKILVIGATSLIAQHCIKIWNSRGDKLFLVGRNVISMKKILKALKKKGEKNFFFLDVNRIDLHKKMLNKAEKFLGNIDLALISYGTLPNQKKCQTSTHLTLKEIKTNALSTISILTSLANKLEMKRRGTIAVISSLAGDRGRASNYVYGSSKAMITTFLSGYGAYFCWIIDCAVTFIKNPFL